MRCCEIIKRIEELAPIALSEEWDNTGLLVGSSKAEVTRVLVTLDVLEETVEEAIQKGANLIVSHHPILFKPMSAVTDETVLGRTVMKLLKHQISVYATHTNFDSAFGGLCDSLCEKIGLLDTVPLAPNPHDEKAGLGRIGRLCEVLTLSELSEKLLKITGQRSLRMVGEPSTKVQCVAVSNGSGADFISLAKKQGAEVLITGDVKYHEAQTANALGISLIDGGHFGTEKHFIEQMADYLSALDIEVLKTENACDVFDLMIKGEETC